MPTIKKRGRPCKTPTVVVADVAPLADADPAVDGDHSATLRLYASIIDEMERYFHRFKDIHATMLRLYDESKVQEWALVALRLMIPGVREETRLMCVDMDLTMSRFNAPSQLEQDNTGTYLTLENFLDGSFIRSRKDALENFIEMARELRWKLCALRDIITQVDEAVKNECIHN